MLTYIQSIYIIPITIVKENLFIFYFNFFSDKNYVITFLSSLLNKNTP